MKPHPRIRKTIKWGGAAVTVLLVVVWIGSELWTGVWLCGGPYAIDIRHSRLRIERSQRLIVWNDMDLSLAEVVRLIKPVPVRGISGSRWLVSWSGGVADWRLDIPLWVLTAVTLLGTAAAWHLDTLARRRARAGFCPKCNYDRVGLAAGAVCPECGRLLT